MMGIANLNDKLLVIEADYEIHLGEITGLHVYWVYSISGPCTKE